ncbi:MAG: hypothetical protein ABIR52_03355 [Casimicrobiaceae bacterium]
MHCIAVPALLELIPRPRPHVAAADPLRVPLVYPGTVEVRMWLGDAGRTSLGSFYELWSDGKAHADGAARIVWIDLATGRPKPLPANLTAPLRDAA